jgi:3-hydroxybutyryl-CoA dehydrogenase
MNILVVGNELNLAECKQKFGETHQYQLANEAHVEARIKKADVVFDFFIDNDNSLWHHYEKIQAPLFLNTTNTSLIYLKNQNRLKVQAFGFCGLPSFLNREILEVSLLNDPQKIELEKTCNLLGTRFAIVADRVGLITPRIICMIINEAYHTVQEGTASRKDIDLAMKLGTNYPFGPFEWCEKIGVEHINNLLMAVYEDTKDERYKICELLKREFLNQL